MDANKDIGPSSRSSCGSSIRVSFFGIPPPEMVTLKNDAHQKAALDFTVLVAQRNLSVHAKGLCHLDVLRKQVLHRRKAV